MDRKFLTSRGVTVEIKAIQTLLEKFEASSKPPDAPTYEAPTLGGGKEIHPHNETTLRTDAERATWAKYREDLAAYERIRSERLKRLVYLHGLTIEMPADDAWIKAQEDLGIIVPSDPTERRLHYIETEVCGGPGDYLELLQRCMTLGLPEEKIREAEELFRRAMERHPIRGTGDSPEQMDELREVRADTSGIESEPVAALQV